MPFPLKISKNIKSTTRHLSYIFLQIFYGLATKRKVKQVK